MSESEQTKFKAVLNAEDTATLKGALDIAQNLCRYEFAAELDTADAFFKNYVAKNADTRFDNRWLGGLFARNEGERLLGSLGATLTDYGVVSARNGQLFESVPYDEPEAKELKRQAMTEEKLDVISRCFAAERCSATDGSCPNRSPKACMPMTSATAMTATASAPLSQRSESTTAALF